MAMLLFRRPGMNAGPSGPMMSRDGKAGAAISGRIVKIMVGQGHGYIRLSDQRQVYFHRADLKEGIAFNDLRVGSTVTFQLLEDSVSGARALGVTPRRPSR